MSTGNAEAEEDVPSIDDGFYERVRSIVAKAQIDRAHTIPWLANRSRDCSVIYIDEIVPLILPVTKLRSADVIPYHEAGEWMGMEDGYPYPEAHSRFGNSCEKRRVEEFGVTWEAYSDDLAPYIKENETEEMTKVPSDIDERVFSGNKHKHSAPPLVRTDAIIENSNGRMVRYTFSTPDVARDRHTIAAWNLANFNKNPVFLWAHESDKPPIGKIVDMVDNRGTLTGTVQYATAEEYDFADTIFRLVRGGYINAVSVSWNPLEWEWSKDRSRPGGIDFKLAELLEVSQVPVPAHPDALATARTAGINLEPLREWAEKILDDGKTLIIPRNQIEALWREAKMSDSVINWSQLRRMSKRAENWKCGAARDLPTSDSRSWDGPAASASIFSKAGFDGDSPDTSFARKGFLIYDASDPTKKGSYKLPFAKVIDGTLTAVAGGVIAAHSRLRQTDAPSSVLDTAENVILHYKKKLEIGDEASDGKDDRATSIYELRRNLYDVSEAAYLLWCCQGLANACAAEAQEEGDGSPLPDEIAAIAKQLGEWLKKYVAEEVDEAVSLPSGNGSPVGDDMLGRLLKTRSGKILSGASEKALRLCHTHFAQGCEMLSRFIDDAMGVNDNPAVQGTDPDDVLAGAKDEDKARAARERRAKALKLKLGLVA